ncbi:MAG: twin-arginine translocase subunit TatC [Mariprofundaceae bacterium]
MNDEARMGLTAHLGELRTRLTRAVLCLVLGFAACYAVSGALMDLVVAPLKSQLGADMPMIFISLPEVFFARLKVAFVAALFITSPYLLFQLWAFVAPGLYQNERRVFLMFLVSSIVLFVIGGAFAYAFVMPLAFKFFLGFASPDLVAYPTMQLYVSLVLRLAIAFGLAFEVPLVCVLLVKLGAVSCDAMARQRKWVLVGAFVLGSVLTPPDIISQVLLAIPMYLLFELGVFVARRLKQEEECVETASG